MKDIENAIEILKDIYPSQKEIVTGEYPHVADSIDIAIEALKKQLNSGWIPISERLPEEYGFYIFQLIGGKIHEYYYKNEKLYVDIHDESYLFDIKNVIAWQPLPEPYKEESRTCPKCECNQDNAHRHCLNCGYDFNVEDQ